MTTVAILGAGAGAASAAVELARKGLRVRMWNRSPGTLAPMQRAGGIHHEGVLGEGFVRLDYIGTDLAQALRDAQAAVVCLPTFSHGDIARDLADLGSDLPVVLNPGHTGGALAFRAAYLQRRAGLPPLAQFSTLTYVARKPAGDRVRITGRAMQVRAAALPGGETALQTAQELFDCASPEPDVLATDLANVNMVLHPPGAVLAAAWVEARQGGFTFYVDGMTPGVARVARELDIERRRVARAFGHDLPPLVAEMQRIGTVRADHADPDDIAAAVAAGEANRNIMAPDGLAHRYYLEDFGHGIVPFSVLADIAGVAVPVAKSLLLLAETATGQPYRVNGRTARSMGIEGMRIEQLLALVRPHGAARG